MAAHLVGVDCAGGHDGNVRPACCESAVCPGAGFHGYTDACSVCLIHTEPSTRNNGCPARNADYSTLLDPSCDVRHASTPDGHCVSPPNSDCHPNPFPNPDIHAESDTISNTDGQCDLHLHCADVTSAASHCRVVFHANCIRYTHCHFDLHAHLNLYGYNYVNAHTFSHTNNDSHIHSDLNFHPNLHAFIHIHSFVHSNALADSHFHTDTHPNLNGQAIEDTAAYCHASTNADTLLNTYDYLYTN